MGLKNTISDFLQLGALKENAESYVHAKIELTKMEVEDRISEAASQLVWFVLYAIMAFVALLSFLLVLAGLINSVLQSAYMGFVVILLIVLLKLLFFVLYKDRVKAYVNRQVLKTIEKREKLH